MSRRGENDNLLVQKVAANPGAIGVLGYSFLEENADKVQGIPLGGVAPTAETISSLDYPGARPLYIYVKGEHLERHPGHARVRRRICHGPGPRAAISTRRGLIPSPADVQAQGSEAATKLTPLTADGLK